ncbi:hypothetical protein L249_1484 [Ophiocordyceps polyrhachis-furcata BCC 54312]|uniref:Uncharacterized protein n=1 Tax=Ophiocordyceps polyrhachis-furcata BCC 54312 TaxID=1330021 RepID=A0A367L430_9HYPO|nr:hypothetical protein L249_1484 [Ophiocordyceps polyrhachis-furcata BCC 54312]
MSSAAVDDDQIRRAMLDDLGRSRLDILPLSNRECNGSSFRPSRDGGERKFAQEFRVQLKSKWNNVSFEDEEARQMEGLANDDARPWAKKAIDIPVKSAPPRPAKSQAQPIKKQASPPAKKQAQPAKPQPKTKPAKTQPAKPQSVKVQPVKAQAAKTQPSTIQPSKASSNNPPPAKTLPSEAQSRKVRRSKARRSKSSKKAKQKQSEPEAAQSTNSNEDVLCSGICYLPTSNGASEIRVVYALLIDINADSAFLALTLPGSERKVHNVIDLETTIQHDDTCVVTARPGKGSYRYCLRLDERGRNVQLKRYLDALRKHADYVPPQQVADVRPPQQAEVQSSALMDLIDLEISPPATSELPNEVCGSASTVTDAADQLSEFLQRISRELGGCGPGSCEDKAQELEQRATDFWANMGFTESEAEDLLASLRALTRVQKKVRLRQTANSRAGDAACEVSSTIRYSATELESLVGRAAPCPRVRDIVGFGASGTLPTMPANASREKSGLPSMSKCREWLLRSPSESKNPSDAKEAVAWPDHVDPMEIGAVQPVSSTMDVTGKSDTTSEPVLPAAPTSRLTSPVGGPGLETSRWASK